MDVNVRKRLNVFSEFGSEFGSELFVSHRKAGNRDILSFLWSKFPHDGSFCLPRQQNRTTRFSGKDGVGDVALHVSMSLIRKRDDFDHWRSNRMTWRGARERRDDGSK
ncbi:MULTISPECIES: hypothetical protein [unclassified Neorhizobium]|uniref:hypothetical protein n=1 Tax=unclassified Neorhizobium TaxID=2629175 RepID=UPI001FF32B59|nr:MULTISPECIES: hypothetical protein [unclassified Neorhizobium]MCJ9670387.1 hypothetical protein [Neorhizobium sp. SHOUNA12B]MCJ9746300.1 hypothetical protein [Neorhizobium sp. SHOUNA12A]